MDDYCKKSGQVIPAFGNWDYANDLPITQYFESARQAGLLRYACSDDAAEFIKPLHTATRPKTSSTPNLRSSKRTLAPCCSTFDSAGALFSLLFVDEDVTGSVKCQNPRVTTDQIRRWDRNVNLSARKTKEQNDGAYKRKVKIVNIVAKPVDEDLYKIPPELLRTSKTKKMVDFLKRCLRPSCLA